MKSFAQFITEATKFDISQFPIASKTPGFQGYLDTINNALDAKEIPNPVFNDLKYALSNKIKWPMLKLDSSNQEVRNSMPHDVWIKLKQEWSAIFGSGWNENPELHTASGKLKKADAWLANNRNTADSSLIEHAEGYIKQAKEMALLGDAIASLKPLIVKRKIKTDAEKAADKTTKYQAPLASNASVRTVHDVLKQMTEQLMPSLIKALEKKHQGDLARFKSMATDSDALKLLLRGHENKDQPQRQFLYNISSQFGIKLPLYNFNDKNIDVIYPDNLAMRITAKSTDEAQMIQDSFLQKNVAKLASILEAKGKLQGAPTILNLKYSGGMFEGDLQINFADKSSFRVRNKIVISYTYHNMVVRFPTTFHDAMLPTGVRMPGQPSEKEMNTDFVTASPLS